MSSPDFSRIMLKNKRSNRPTQTNMPDYITLKTVKALLANELYIYTNTSITIDFIRDFISPNIKLDTITYYVICLYLTIIFKTEKHVFNFLRSFLKDHGQIATELLVNFTYTTDSTDEYQKINLPDSGIYYAEFLINNKFKAIKFVKE